MSDAQWGMLTADPCGRPGLCPHCGTHFLQPNLPRDRTVRGLCPRSTPELPPGRAGSTSRATPPFAPRPEVAAALARGGPACGPGTASRPWSLLTADPPACDPYPDKERGWGGGAWGPAPWGRAGLGRSRRVPSSRRPAPPPPRTPTGCASWPASQRAPVALPRGPRPG